MDCKNGFGNSANNLLALEGTLQLAAKSLPKGYVLYDFGGNNIVAPRPDTNQNGYLTNHIAAIERVRDISTDPIVVTAFGFDLQFVTARQVVEGMEKALESNKTQTKEFEII